MAKRTRPKRTRPLTPAEQLDALYAELPPIDCKGLCHDSCTSIGMTEPEQKRLARAGIQLPLVGPTVPVRCPALTEYNRCSAYEVRPTICRLFGLTEGMVCTFGCRPEGGLLPDQQGYEVLARAFDIAGDAEAAERCRAPFRDPERTAVSRALLRRDRLDRAVNHDQRERIAGERGTLLYAYGGRLAKPRDPDRR